MKNEPQQISSLHCAKRMQKSFKTVQWILLLVQNNFQKGAFTQATHTFNLISPLTRFPTRRTSSIFYFDAVICNDIRVPIKLDFGVKGKGQFNGVFHKIVHLTYNYKSKPFLNKPNQA